MGHPTELAGIALLAGEYPSHFFTARVERVDAEEVDLRVGRELARGRRAVSCLIVPQVGDVVSVLRDGDNKLYLMAILERNAGNGELVLSSERALTLESSAGSVQVRAAGRLDLVAGKQVRVRAPLLEVLADRWSAFAKTLQFTAGELLLNCRLARLCAELADVAAQRIGVTARHSHRMIEGTEQLRCQHFDLHASEIAQIRAPVTLIKSKNLAKVDAAQIQIG